MNRKNVYTVEQLEQAVASSLSLREVLIKLGIKAEGGNYATLKQNLKKYAIDTSHFKGMGRNAGMVFGPKRSIETYLTNEARITSHHLRVRLIREAILPNRCSSCDLENWLGQPIPLELEHVNGNHLDNTLSNLRLLCPNCHALTPTYRRAKSAVNKR